MLMVLVKIEHHAVPPGVTRVLVYAVRFAYPGGVRGRVRAVLKRGRHTGWPYWTSFTLGEGLVHRTL